MTPKVILMFLFFNEMSAQMSPYECTLSRDSMDLCGRQLMVLGDHSHHFPDSVESTVGTETVCGPTRDEWVECVNSFADNCLQTFTKTLIKAFVSNTSRMLSNQCSHVWPNVSHVTFTCLNGRSLEVRECMQTFVAELETIGARVRNKELLIPYTCCRFEALKQCVTSVMATCGQSDGLQVMASLLTPLSHLTCSQHNNHYSNHIVHKCEHLEPLEPKDNTTTTPGNIKLQQLKGEAMERSLSPLLPFIVIANALAPTHPCVSQLDKVDNCALSLLVFGDREQTFAATAHQLDANTCPRVKRAIDCLTHFETQCVNASSSHVLSHLIDGARTHYRKRCEASERYDALQFAHCLNGVITRLNSMHLCYDSFVTQLETLHFEVIDPHIRLLYFCCGFHAMKKCAINALTEECVHSRPYLRQMVDTIGGQLMANKCHNYAYDSPFCEALVPLSGAPKDITSSAQSFVKPFIEMFGQ